MAPKDKELYETLFKDQSPVEYLKITKIAEWKKFNKGDRVPFAMGSRAFLHLLGGVGAGIGALKAGALKLFSKEGATVAKELTQVPIKNIEGMPTWFKPLVNKVI